MYRGGFSYGSNARHWSSSSCLWRVSLWVCACLHTLLSRWGCCPQQRRCINRALAQHIVTSTITTIFTIFTSFGLAAVSAWFASERYIYQQHSGGKWLSDVIQDAKEQFLAIPGVKRIRKFFRGIQRRSRAAKKALARLSSKTANLILRDSSDSEKSDDLEANILPTSNGGGYHTRETSPSAMTSVIHLQSTDELTPTASPSPEPAVPSTPTLSGAGSEAGGTTAPVSGPSKGKLLWKTAMQTVKMRSVAAAPFGPRTPHRQRTSSSTTNFGERKRTLADEPIRAVLARSRIATLKPKLGKLMATEALEAHQALVRHLQFSPDGKFLATSRWVAETLLYRERLC